MWMPPSLGSAAVDSFSLEESSYIPELPGVHSKGDVTRTAMTLVNREVFGALRLTATPTFGRLCMIFVHRQRMNETCLVGSTSALITRDALDLDTHLKWETVRGGRRASRRRRATNHEDEEAISVRLPGGGERCLGIGRRAPSIHLYLPLASCLLSFRMSELTNYLLLLPLPPLRLQLNSTTTNPQSAP
jgi:hypothetical protein